MRNQKEKMMLFLVGFLALLAAVLIVMACMFHVVDFKLYRKNLEVLDLRDQPVSVAHYEKLAHVMPECEILWNIPFQGSTLPHDTQEVTITSLTEEDLTALSHMKNLRAVHAQGCRDYALLARLQELQPQAEVRYTVAMNGQEFPLDAQSIEVTAASEEEVRNLAHLKQLKEVVIRGSDTQENFHALRSYCKDAGIALSLKLGQSLVPVETAEVTVAQIQDNELYLLDYLSQMKTLHLVSPKADPEKIPALKDLYPDVKVSWEVDLFGVTIANNAVPEKLDLSKVNITSLEELEHSLACLEGVKEVYLGAPNIDNEQIAQYRDRVREQYKVVWSIHFTNDKLFRTDSTFFFPARDGYAIDNVTVQNLRYCEDLITIDVGHLGVETVDFLAYLPNLEYLILAHTGVQYINGIENCKKLKFLELDWTGIRDLTPLQGCTALEDLNIGKTWPDVTPLTQMPWLKHVYMIFGSSKAAWTLTQALPNTRVVVTGTATVSSGWRRLPNYYAMRDSMGAKYMN